MRKLLGALFVAGLLVGSANAQGRIYFDLTGSTPGNQAESDAPHPGVTTKENPNVNGSARLYIYWEFGAANQNVFRPNYDITVDNGNITEAWNFNNTNIGGIGLTRWQPVGDPVSDYAVDPWNFPGGTATPGTNPISFTSADIDVFGLVNDARHQSLDNQLAIGDGPFGSTLLGYVDVEAEGFATVWLTVGKHGIGVQGGLPNGIFFGFGDGSLDADTVGQRSDVADATINIPEPAGLMLLGLGFLAMRRRR